MPSPRGQLKTWLFVALVIFSNSFGNFFLARGMRNLPNVDSVASLIQAMFAPLVAIGILLLIVWLLTRMMLLSWADLSYVLPVTSSGYVASVLFGRFLLHEQVSWTRWAGTILIVCGTILVGLGAPHTHSGDRQ
jgi:drug/metabolite transporter (DMT)-like permease